MVEWDASLRHAIPRESRCVGPDCHSFLWWYIGSMKVKTSITLSEEVLNDVDRAAGPESRSTFIEGVLKGFLRRRALDQEQDRDRQILDGAASALNDEASDVSEYQAAWFQDG